MMKKTIGLILVALLTAQCWALKPVDEPTNAIAPLLGLAAAFSAKPAAVPAIGSSVETFQFSPVSVLGSGLIPPVNSIGSDATNLYLGTVSEIIAVDKATGARTVLTGNMQSYVSGAYWPGTAPAGPTFPGVFTRENDYLYFSSASYGRIQRLFVGSQAQRPIETVVPIQSMGEVFGVGLSNVRVSANSSSLFWIGYYTGQGSVLFEKSLTADTPPKLLGRFSGEFNILATDSVLYLYKSIAVFGPPSDGAIIRFELSTRTTTTFPVGVTLPSSSSQVTTVSADRFYWLNGSTIYSSQHVSTASDVACATGIPGIDMISASGDSVFALQTNIFPGKIFRVDLDACNVTLVVTSYDPILSILSHNGALYWSTPYELQRLNPDQSTQTLYSNNGSEIVFGRGMMAIGGRILAWGGGVDDAWLSYDVGSGSYATASIRASACSTGASCPTTNGSMAYAISDSGIVSIPPDLRMRVPETLAMNQGVVGDLLVEDGWIYWSESVSSGIDKLARARIDGTSQRTLYTGSHRGLILYNERLYFMCDSCSVPGWAIVSIPKDGVGAMVPEVGLGSDPQSLIRKGDVFYLTDALPGLPRLALALNMPLQQASAIGPAYSNSKLAVLDNTFYIGSTRYKINAWNSYGPGHSVPVFGVVHGSGSSLYWWDQSSGLRKVDE